jgi:threonyl-tRNA synthetase
MTWLSLQGLHKRKQTGLYIIEHKLAHIVSGAISAVYNRTNFIEQSDDEVLG